MHHLVIFIFIAISYHFVVSSPITADLTNDYRRMESHEEMNNMVREQAIEQLSEVFGIPNHRTPHLRQNNSPPQFMIDLYRSIADDSGITRAPNPYHADIIRSFPNKGHKSKTFYYFNVSSVPNTEDILQAEMHLFKLKPKGRVQENLRQHYFEVHVYQLLSDDMNTNNAKLIGARLVSAVSTGWEVFSISSAVSSWLQNPSSNHGLLITVTTMTGVTLRDNAIIRFAKKKEHHGSKQPILVVFTNDKKRKQLGYADGSGSDSMDYDYTYDYIMQTYGDILHPQPATERHRKKKPAVNTHTNRYEDMTRHRRASSSERPSEPAPTRQWKTPCSRQRLYVDFEEIGWSGWIISPRGYNAYHCKGECPFPLGQASKPTNHATVQSIVNALQQGDEVAMPCCVPDKLFSISLLYFDEDDNVVLKQYDDMVAASCGCH